MNKNDTDTIIGNKTYTDMNLKKNDTGSHYRFEWNGLKLDPYRISLIYKIANPAQQQVLKKVLCAGNRGNKDLRRDIAEIQTACDRWLEILDEDEDD